MFASRAVSRLYIIVHPRGRYDCAADIWSFGITLLELALGEAPLAHFNLDQIMLRTMNNEPPVLESSDRRKRFTNVRAPLCRLRPMVAVCLSLHCEEPPVLGSSDQQKRFTSVRVPSLVINLGL